MTIIVVGAAIYAGLVILIVALLRAAARRDRDERAWLHRQRQRAEEPDPGQVGSRSPLAGGPRSLIVVRHPSSGLRPVIVDITPGARARARNRDKAPDPA